jgi:hypothetical protein
MSLYTYKNISSSTSRKRSEFLRWIRVRPLHRHFATLLLLLLLGIGVWCAWGCCDLKAAGEQSKRQDRGAFTLLCCSSTKEFPCLFVCLCERLLNVVCDLVKEAPENGRTREFPAVVLRIPERASWRKTSLMMRIRSLLVFSTPAHSCGLHLTFVCSLPATVTARPIKK